MTTATASGTTRAFFVRAGVVVVTLLLALGVYLLMIRPWQLRWGATDDEVARSLPGDEIVSRPAFNATRAVTVRARPEEIWPWIVQIGDLRAGFYSYDWFDNRGKPSAERILPELQRLRVGDEIPISSAFHMRVQSMDRPRSIVWIGSEEPPLSTWVWHLEPIDEHHTRLLTRMRTSYDWTSPTIVMQLWVDWGDFPFLRKCMLGIKQRAEGRTTDSYLGDVAEGVQWGVAFFEFLAAISLIMSRRQWWYPWALAATTAAVFLLIFYIRPPLWLGALAETTILFGLLWCRRATDILRGSPWRRVDPSYGFGHFISRYQ